MYIYITYQRCYDSAQHRTYVCQEANVHMKMYHVIRGEGQLCNTPLFTVYNRQLQYSEQLRLILVTIKIELQ